MKRKQLNPVYSNIESICILTARTSDAVEKDVIPFLSQCSRVVALPLRLYFYSRLGRLKKESMFPNVLGACDTNKNAE